MNDGVTAGTAASNAPRPGPNRTVALIGLMGAGKSAVGKRLAKRLARAFTDADQEIERAAGCSIADFFSAMARVNFAAARSESSPAYWRGRRLFWRPAVAPLCRQ